MKLAVSLVAIACALAPAASAQGLRAVRPLDGYVCMNLAVPDAQLRDPHWPGVPILTAPSPDAPRGALAAATVIAKAPPHLANGYAEVLRLNGQPGWIEADKIKPYSSASNPYARCTPSIMSNGRPGFG